ncbi:MAG: hypothetical protein ACE5FU_13230 [Nitrospinota bacterium]
MKINKGDEIYGFVLKKRTSLEALKATAYELEHKKSGARLLHIHAEDQENLLSIAFRPPPPMIPGYPIYWSTLPLEDLKKSL